MTQLNVIEAMKDPRFYPHAPEAVEFIQTHISCIYIAGEYVYKVKKPVNFGFLDFTTLEKRGYYCREEVRLNRRLAPEIYLDVLSIREDESGKPAFRADGQLIEYCVQMRKIPQDKMLKRLFQERKVTPAMMEAVAQKVAAFHAAADTGGGIDEGGSVDTIRFNHEENFCQTARYINRTIRAPHYDFIKAYDEKFVDENSALFEQRVRLHRIRDCHGDLHLEHICIDGENIIIFDCIEFNERFRYGDVAAEVAFLAMDLDFNGHSLQAEIFVDAYVKASGDGNIKILLNFYKCYYAYVRGKVTSFRLDDADMSIEEKRDATRTARRYFDLAYKYAAHLEKPALILIGGLMGTGKSALARAMAPCVGGEIVRSDVVRKEMLSIDPAERHPDAFRQGIYSDDISRRTYDRALEIAVQKISAGKTAIVDASFKRKEERAEFFQAASRAGKDFFMIECTCPDNIVRERLERRTANKMEASDGRWEIYEDQKKDFDAITEFPPALHFVCDTSKTIHESAHEAIKYIRRIQGGGNRRVG